MCGGLRLEGSAVRKNVILTKNIFIVRNYSMYFPDSNFNRFFCTIFRKKIHRNSNIIWQVRYKRFWKRSYKYISRLKYILIDENAVNDDLVRGEKINIYNLKFEASYEQKLSTIKWYRRLHLVRHFRNFGDIFADLKFKEILKRSQNKWPIRKI